MFPRRRAPYAEHVLCVLMRAADSQALVMCVQLDIVGGLQCVLESFDYLMPNPYLQKPLANSLFCYVFGPLYVASGWKNDIMASAADIIIAEFCHDRHKALRPLGLKF